ncbi:MAG: MobF family relaxase [Parasphingopyxis sp.]
MLSVATVSSSSGAAAYFAKDDYYTGGEPGEHSEWGGRGAAALGLSGEVTKEAFERILNGQTPDGEQVGRPGQRLLGMDLTFSMPKSASILALIGDDARILEAHRQAVRKTMAWAETRFAEGRSYTRTRAGEAVRTGSLVYALFEHETSRALDPQGHIHAIIANMTRMPDGSWRALHNGQLWQNNTTIGAAYHAQFRERLEKLGYATRTTGKHGQFEIAAVPEKAIAEFSQRRRTILEKSAELDIKSSAGRAAVTLRTRDAKLNVENRASLFQTWRDRAQAIGLDAWQLVHAAGAKSAAMQKPAAIAATMRDIGARLGSAFRNNSELTDSVLANTFRPAEEVATQHATASAIHALIEREAAFAPTEVMHRALSLGLPGVTAERVESRVAMLVDESKLIPGVSRRRDGVTELLTTPRELANEQAILDHITRGRGASAPVIPAEDIARRLSDATENALNAGQRAAATLVLCSGDRFVAVEGVAGSGKSTMLAEVARLASEEGKTVIGLAFQNKMVLDLKEGAGIEAQTVSAFVNAHIRVANATSRRSKTGPLKDTILVVDEGSMIANKPMKDLMRITERLGADRLVVVGDRKQLAAIDAGKSFSLMQAGGTQVARMDKNLRQQTTQLRTIAALANRGEAGLAISMLGNSVQESSDHVRDAAKEWLALKPAEQARTAIFASGREARRLLNSYLQDGLKASGAIDGEGKRVRILERLNLAHEELRDPNSYHKGNIVDVAVRRPEIGLANGQWKIVGRDHRGRVLLEKDGKLKHFNPQTLRPGKTNSGFSLATEREIELHKNDTIRWTANDKARGIHNSARARVTELGRDHVTIETADKTIVSLTHDDPMLRRLDLAYALNMHMAQGMTVDKGIAVMASHERYLSSQQLFNVTVSRVRNGLRLFTDDRAKLSAQIERTPGTKTSAIETTGKLAIDEPRNHRGQGSFRDRSKDAATVLRSDSAQPVKPEPDRTPERTMDLKL